MDSTYLVNWTPLVKGMCLVSSWIMGLLETRQASLDKLLGLSGDGICKLLQPSRFILLLELQLRHQVGVGESAVQQVTGGLHGLQQGYQNGAFACPGLTAPSGHHCPG